MERIAVVLAAGGERVVPWQTGVLAGLADAGLDMRDAAAIVGTSAARGHPAGARHRPPRCRRPHLGAGVPRAPAELVARASATLPRLLAIQADGRSRPAALRRRFGRFALAAQTIPEDAHVAAVTSRLPAGGWPDALRLMALDTRTGELVRLDRTSGIRSAAAWRRLVRSPACCRPSRSAGTG